MPEEKVTTEVCHNLRTEIYQMIFPRWALILALGIIGTVIGVIYYQGSGATVVATEAKNKTNLLEERFTVTVEHIKENQTEMKEEMKEQRTLLQKIDRRLDGRPR